MKCASILLLMFLLLVFVNGQPKPNSFDSLRMKYQLYELDNGLQVLLQPDSTLEDVAVEFWLKVGIKDEKTDEYGFAHFFEHVTPYGLRGKSEESKLLSSYRTRSNAQVRKDFIRYYTKVKPEGLDLALQYSADRINSKSTDITDKRVESERIRVLSEIERNSKYPFWSAGGGMMLSSVLFGETHPYGHSSYGLIENNKNFKTEDFQKWYDRYVYPGNTILFVVGNFDKDVAKKKINQHFGKIPKKKGVGNSSIIQTPVQNRKSFTVQTNSNEHHLALVWATPEWGSAEDATLRIISNLLDKRLKNVAKQNDKILKTNATTLLDMYQYAGQFGIYASFSNIGDKAEIESFLGKEIKILLESGITEPELKLAKQKEIQTIKKMQQNLGFQNSRTQLLGESLLFRNDPDAYFGRLKQQINLKKEEVEKITKFWLGKSPSKILFKSKESVAR